MNRLSLALIASTLCAVSAQAQWLNFTSFETPNYVVGQSTEGVGGWTTLLSPQANEIVNGHATASSGRRALSVWGGSPNLTPIGGLLDGAWRRDVTVPAAYAQTAIVHVQCDVRLDGPDTGTGPNDDLLSANLYARNGSGQTPFMYLSSTGEVFCFANSSSGSTGYAFQTDVGLGHYARLAMTLDYTSHVCTFWVNYHIVGQLPFGGAATERFEGPILEFAAYDNLAYVDPSLYRGYWDNLLVVSFPGCR